MQRHFDMLLWTEDRIAHVARHGVTPEEVDEAFEDEDNRLIRGRNGVYRLYGRTEAGRILMVVITPRPERTGYPVTARDVTDTERRTYFEDY